MDIIQGILAAIPVIGQIIVLFQKTPQEKWEAHTQAILKFIQELHQGVADSQKSKGDTSSLEGTINGQ